MWRRIPRMIFLLGIPLFQENIGGGKANASVKKLMIVYASQWFTTIWFHIAPSNIRSQKATEKIGAIFFSEESLDLGGGKKLWASYKFNVTV